MNWRRIQIVLAKKLDALVGYLLVFGFPRRDRCSRSAPEEVKRILFIKFWGLGSIVLSEPALRFLKHRYPSARLDYLTFQQNRGLFDLIPAVDKVYTLPYLDPVRFVLFAVALIVRLRRERYDLVFDAEFFVNSSAILARLLRPGHLVGFGSSPGTKTRLMDSIVRFSEEHTAGLFLKLARMGSAGSLLLRPSITVPDAVSPVNLPRQFIAVNINAGPLAYERRWPVNHFLGLCSGLLERYPFHLVLTGSSSEVRYVTRFEHSLSQPDRVLNLAGRISLARLCRVLESALLLISNDSGPVHLASALDIPVVALYGPETPARYGPLSTRKLVFYRRLWCSPCMSLANSKTVDCINALACLRELSAEEVLQQTATFIESLCSADEASLDTEMAL